MKNRSVLFKLLVVVGVLVFVTVVAFAIFGKVQQDGKGRISIVVIPNDSIISIDGQEKGKISEIYLTPGSHKITAKRSGFSDAEKTATAIIGQTTTVNLILITTSKEGYTWNSQHPEQIQKKEEIAGQEVNQDGINFSKKNPITTKIPYRTPHFRIDYSLNPDNSVNLIISGYSSSAQNLALLQIKQWGFKPEDYKITFKNLSN